MSIETMKLALEALELAKNSHGMMLLSDPPQEAWKTYRVDDAIKKSTTALRQAIEQSQKQEPVGRFSKFTDGVWREVTVTSAGQPLYTAPPQRQPLTDEQIERLEAMCIDPIDSKGWGFLNRKSFARAIEAAHGIKGET